jgi:hypothetical protein
VLDNIKYLIIDLMPAGNFYIINFNGHGGHLKGDKCEG